MWYTFFVAKTAKIQTSIRLTAEAKRMLTRLAKQMGLSEGSVLEVLIREASRPRSAESRDTRSRDEFRKGDPGHPANEMGM